MWFKDELLGNCIVAALPRGDHTEIVVDGHLLPSGMSQLLTIANGMITGDRYFRVFGTTAHPEIPSLEDWNRAQWKKDYKNFANDIIFVADDIFGDQYGYEFHPDGHDFVKFFCEGGDVEIVQGGINRLIETLIDPRKTNLVDVDLSRQAFERGLRPTGDEHLAFRLPLIGGGEYSVENLHIEPVNLHLGILAQITMQSASLADGTPITGFYHPE